MYDNGTGVQKDYSVAMRLYRLAAGQGNAVAQYNLGEMYHAGRGVSQDYAEAARWFRMAADQGDDDAQVSLGTMYVEGLGVEQNYNEAIRLYGLAVEQGNAVGRTVTSDFIQPDNLQDLALIKAEMQPRAVAFFRSGRGIRPGDSVYAYGFPLQCRPGAEAKGRRRTGPR